MSKTRMALEKLTLQQQLRVDGYKRKYNRKGELQSEARKCSGAYLHGLCDAGVISETERRALLCYITL